MKQLLIAALLLTLTINSSLAQKIMPNDSYIEFTVTNFGKEVTGKIVGLKGVVKLDPQNLADAMIWATANPATVSTQNAKRDKHLLKDDYFEVEKYPTIDFKSSSVEKSESGYLLKGMLTILETSEEVEIAFTRESDGHYSEYSGTLVLKRKDYDLGGKNKKMVGNEISIKIFVKVHEPHHH